MASNYRTEISAFINTNLSDAARSRALADFARAERDKLIKSGQASARYTTYVDGHVDPNEDHVKGTGGIIHYRFSDLGDATEFALTYLRYRVPKVSGLLSESFWVSINGDYYSPGESINYNKIPLDAEVVIGNTEAYWRKADLNLKGKRELRYRAPDEIKDCVSALNARFGRTSIKARRVYNWDFPGRYEPRLSPMRLPYIFNSPVLVIIPA